MENKLTSFIFDKLGINRYQKYMDLASLRHRLTASNISNVSTPGYQSRDIDFQQEFAKATGEGGHLKGSVTHANHIPTGQHEGRPPKVNKTRVPQGDLNSVDIDAEIPKMAQNELLYTVGARLLEKKFSGLQKAITSK